MRPIPNFELKRNTPWAYNTHVRTLWAWGGLGTRLGYCTLFLVQDFTSHCRELNKKVMNIMDELIQKHISKVRLYVWYMGSHSGCIKLRQVLRITLPR